MKIASIFSVWFLTASVVFGAGVDGITQPSADHVGILAPQIDSFVCAVLVKRGDTVKKGQAIIKMDEPNEKLLQRKRDINLAAANLNAARKTLENAASVANRALVLREKNAICQAEYDQQICDRDKAIETVNVAEAQLASAKGALTLESTTFSYYTVRAPIDGVVVKLDAHLGDMANPGRIEKVWGKVLDTSVIDVACKVSEQDVIDCKIKAGLEATVVCNDKSFPCRVIFVSPELEEGNLPVLVQVDNKEGLILINKKVRVIFR